MDLSDLPDQRAMHHPLGTAVADDISDLNNTEFLDAVQRAAATLRSRGVSAGDVVAIKPPRGGWVPRSHRSTPRCRRKRCAISLPTPAPRC